MPSRNAGQLLSAVVEISAARFPSKASGKGEFVAAAVFAARWIVTVVGFDLLPVFEGTAVLTISSFSSSSSFVGSFRRCTSYRLIEDAWCRLCRSEDDVSVLARTVEVRHARSRRNDRAIRKRGARELVDLDRLWVFEAGQDDEAMVTSDRAIDAKGEFNRI